MTDEFYRLIRLRQEQGEWITSAELLAWCNGGEIRLEALLGAFRMGELELHSDRKRIQNGILEENLSAIVEVSDTVVKDCLARGDDPERPCHVRNFVKRLLEGDHLEVNPEELLSWLEKFYPVPLDRIKKYTSQSVTILDKAYQALYVKNHPPKDQKQQEEKKRIEIWFEGEGYNIKSDAIKRIISMINPYRAPNSKIIEKK